MSDNTNEISHDRIEEKLDAIGKHVEKIDQTLHGNGRDGLVTRVDRNTQVIGMMTRFGWILLTAIVGVAVLAMTI